MHGWSGDQPEATRGLRATTDLSSRRITFASFDGLVPSYTIAFLSQNVTEAQRMRLLSQIGVPRRSYALRGTVALKLALSLPRRTVMV